MVGKLEGKAVDLYRRRSNTEKGQPKAVVPSRKSFSSVASQSTISTKPQMKSELPPKEPTVLNTRSQSSLSTRLSIRSKVQQSQAIQKFRRSRSGGENSSKRQQPPQQNQSMVRPSPSSPRPPVYPTTSTTTNSQTKTGLIRNSSSIPRTSTPTSRSSPNHLLEEATKRRQERKQKQQHQVPRILPGMANSNTMNRNGSRTTFHVRLSIGYMVGLKMEKIAKWTRQPSNNRLIVGFVELASSGKYSALSQPLLTNVGDIKGRTTKVLWANPRGGKDASKSRRRLHFSLQLERDAAFESRQDDDDDDSFASLGSYTPEVVKLVVGLKCGEEKLPLGVAKFVVNGRETVEQKLDLAVQPSTGPNTGGKTKRGIFGKRQQKNSFTNGDQNYRLAPNATLRVKVDIKTAEPGIDGAAVWGQQDDSSYTTNWTYDTSNTHSFQNNNITGNNSAAAVASPSNSLPTRQNSLIGESYRSGVTDRQYNASAENANNVSHHVPPVPFVSLKSSDVMSYMSGLTGPDKGCDGFWFTRNCLPLFCGESSSSNGNNQMIARSFSFESSQRMSEEIQISLDTSSSGDSSNEVGEDLKGKMIQINNNKNIVSGKTPVQQKDEEEVETLDVTVETYNDLKDAQATLMKYALARGVDMDDLLEEMDKSEKRSRGQDKSRLTTRL